MLEPDKNILHNVKILPQSWSVWKCYMENSTSKCFAEVSLTYNFMLTHVLVAASRWNVVAN